MSFLKENFSATDAQISSKNLLTLIYPTKSVSLFFLKRVLKMSFLKGDFSATNARIISSKNLLTLIYPTKSISLFFLKRF
jgi:hypothetical protein